MVAKVLDPTHNIKGLLTGWGLATRPCDVCRAASALLYCRADAAFLCGLCDAKIHVTDHLTRMITRHERVWLCEVCEQAPAVVACKADAAVLCMSCDHDIHSANPLARRHERVPVIPFLDSAADAALLSSLNTSSNFLNPNKNVVTVPVPVPAPVEFDNSSSNDDEDSELLLIPNLNSSFLYNDSYLLDCGAQNRLEKHSKHQNQESLSFAITDSDVPAQSNGTLSFSNTLFDSAFEIDFSQPPKHHNNKKNKHNNFNHHQFYSSSNSSAQHTVSSSDIGVVPESNTNSSSEFSNTFRNSAISSSARDVVTQATGESPTVGLDREARVLRYREKRKNRKFQKTIRYASRKAYAETRPRVKGRFAKRTGNNETPLHTFNIDSGCNFGLDSEYGVVPTFLRFCNEASHKGVKSN